MAVILSDKRYVKVVFPYLLNRQLLNKIASMYILAIIGWCIIFFLCHGFVRMTIIDECRLKEL